MRLVWFKAPGKTFMLFALFVSTTIPVIVIGLTIATSGYAYGIGNVCMVEHEKSAATLYGWIVGIAVLAILLAGVTTGYLAAQRGRHGGQRRARGSLVLDGGPVVKRRVNIVDVLRQEARQIITATLVPIELLILASILWATDRGLANAKQSERMSAFVGCLVANQGQTQLCEDLAARSLPSQSAVLCAFILLAVSRHIFDHSQCKTDPSPPAFRNPNIATTYSQTLASQDVVLCHPTSGAHCEAS